MKKIEMAGMSARAQGECLNEAKLLSKLAHRNVIKYFDSFVDGATLCIVMELASKGSLMAYLKARRTPQRLTSAAPQAEGPEARRGPDLGHLRPDRPWRAS
jgi:serine/threonine protein kinase